jgi:hypothetical protein
MHSAGINPHGNPHVTARGLQQPEPTAPAGAQPTSSDEDGNSSFGAAVEVTLSARAKAHLADGTEAAAKGKNMNSPAHQARALMAEAGFAESDGASMPFGKIVSQIARFGYDAAVAMFSPQEVTEEVDETAGENPEGVEDPATVPVAGDGDEGAGTVVADDTLAPVPPLEDLLLDEGLLGQPAVDADSALVDVLLDDGDDTEETLTA